MRTIVIFQSNVRGMQYGIGTYIKNLSHEIAARGERVIIVKYHCKNIKGIEKETLTDNLSEIRIPSPTSYRLTQDKFDRRYAECIITAIEPTISKCSNVLFHVNSVDAYKLVDLLKELYPARPVVITSHFSRSQIHYDGNELEAKKARQDKSINKEFYDLVEKEKAFYHAADYVITVCQDMQHFLEEEFEVPHNKITTIYNGMAFGTQKENHKKEIREKYGYKEDDFVILFVGRLDEIKGISHISKAMDVFGQIHRNAHIVFAGEGGVDSIIQNVPHVFRNVSLVGFVPHEQVVEFIEMADCGILLSYYEHCPYSLLEMVEGRLPMIVSRVFGNREIFDEGECVYVNPTIDAKGNISFNQEDIVNALENICSNSFAYKEMAERARKHFSEKYALKRMGDETMNVYNKLFERKENCSCDC